MTTEQCCPHIHMDTCPQCPCQRSQGETVFRSPEAAGINLYSYMMLPGTDFRITKPHPDAELQSYSMTRELFRDGAELQLTWKMTGNYFQEEQYHITEAMLASINVSR